MDKYSLFARIYPMVIFFLPIVVIGVSYSVVNDSYIQSLSSIGITSVLTYFLSQVGRDRGKKKETKLWEKWGGMPSVQILRPSNERIDPHTKARYIAKLKNVCPAEPTSDQMEYEDSQFHTWTKFLISKTRDTKKFTLLFKENINYGFRRNLWALKPLAIWFIIFCIFSNYVYQSIKEGIIAFSSFPISFYITQLALLTILFLWSIIITPDWVKIPAFAYAERLLETIEEI